DACLTVHLLLCPDPNLPRPHIFLSPSGVIDPGGEVNISCLVRHVAKAFYLYTSAIQWTGPPFKQGPLYESKFTISSANQEHVGNYCCSYHDDWNRFIVSEPSDPTELWVSDPGLPRPHISRRPSWVITKGENITIQCQATPSRALFFLSKRGSLPPKLPRYTYAAKGVSEFPISNVSLEHAGSYSCLYHFNTTGYISSEPSDPMDLVLSDPSLPRPNISRSPSGLITPGTNVTFRCQGWGKSHGFYLRMAGDGSLLRPMVQNGDVAELPIRNVSRAHAGNYSCSYRSSYYSSSEPSTPVELLLRAPPQTLDYTQTNIIRLAVAGAVLLLLVLIIAEDRHSRRQRGLGLNNGGEAGIKLEVVT
uniref:Ig-like domain-containing protein n=1 Tax=Sphenodon punctatus TaxID=8508 RepID=A0A8D0LAB5_SPHPU